MKREDSGRKDAPASVLAIDTATSAASVGLYAGGESRMRELAWRDSFRAAAAAVERLLAERGIALGDLDAIAIPAGPGSFTGLRVGAALALGLCRVSGVPLHAVPTLAAVAEVGAPTGTAAVCATLDARRGRRYAAVYEREAPGRWRLVAGPLDGTPDQITALSAGRTEVPLEAAAPGGIAGAIARLVLADPRAYELTAPGALILAYARPGVDLE